MSPAACPETKAPTASAASISTLWPRSFAVVGLVGVVILLRNESRHGKGSDRSNADADEEAVTG